MKHKDCQNFEYLKSWCKFKNVQVDPNGPACSDFKERIIWA